MDLFVQLRAVVFRHFCAICASLHTVFHLRLCDTYMYVERERKSTMHFNFNAATTVHGIECGRFVYQVVSIMQF